MSTPQCVHLVYPYHLFVLCVFSFDYPLPTLFTLYPPPAAISGSGDTLPCKHVIHVHSPQWSDKEAVPMLEKAVKSCLTLAENKNLSTLAFPSVASGS